MEVSTSSTYLPSIWGGIVIARRGRIVRVLRRGCHHSRTIWRSCESARHGPFIYAIVYVYALHPRIDVMIRRDAPSVEVKGRHVWIISSTRHFHLRTNEKEKLKSFVARERGWWRVTGRGFKETERGIILVSFEWIKLRGRSRLRSGQKSNERRTTSAIFVSSTREKPQNPLRFQATHLPRRISQPPSAWHQPTSKTIFLPFLEPSKITFNDPSIIFSNLPREQLPCPPSPPEIDIRPGQLVFLRKSCPFPVTCTNYPRTLCSRSFETSSNHRNRKGEKDM